jgi:hypothetical protein
MAAAADLNLLLHNASRERVLILASFGFHAGRYDWSGELELAPDPFIEWQDAASLLYTNTSSNSTPGSDRRRSLLQDATNSSDNSNSTSTGMVPVQGRVGIRESKAPVDSGTSSNPGSVALDDTGDIVLICLNGICPPSLTGIPGQAETPDGTQTQLGNSAQSPISAASGSKLLVILLAALVAPAGLAICATGIAAAVLRKRRKQSDDEQARDATKQKPTNNMAGQDHHDELQLQGRQGVKQSWRSADGTSWVPGATPSPAVLRRSNAGGSTELTDADLALQQGTSIERLQPGETGFGSVYGGRSGGAAMVTLPPARDSVDGCVVERSRGSRWSLAGSVAGVASSISNALHLRQAAKCHFAVYPEGLLCFQRGCCLSRGDAAQHTCIQHMSCDCTGCPVNFMYVLSRFALKQCCFALQVMAG